MALKIHTGELNKRITIKRPVTISNNEGGQERSYTDYLNTSAAVRELSQSRTSDPTALLHTKQFIIRYAEDRKELTKDYLILYDGKTYTINSIERDGEKKEWIVLTGKVRSDG